MNVKASPCPGFLLGVGGVHFFHFQSKMPGIPASLHRTSPTEFPPLHVLRDVKSGRFLQHILEGSPLNPSPVVTVCLV